MKQTPSDEALRRLLNDPRLAKKVRKNWPATVLQPNDGPSTTKLEAVGFKPKHRQLLIASGNGKVGIAGADEVTHGDETYIFEQEKRIWLDKSLPRGWVTIHFKGNPEPITEAGCEGYNAKFLRTVMGPVVKHWLEGGLEEPKKRISLPWQVWVGGIVILVIIVGAIVAVGAR